MSILECIHLRKVSFFGLCTHINMIDLDTFFIRNLRGPCLYNLKVPILVGFIGLATAFNWHPTRSNTGFYQSEHYHSGLNSEAIYNALELIPSDAIVSASNVIVPHIAKCFEDFSRCGALMVSERCESFMSDVSSSPFGRVPKKDFFGFVTREGRRLCFRGKGVEPNCPVQRGRLVT